MPSLILLQACARGRAVLSVVTNPKFQDKESAERAVNEVEKQVHLSRDMPCTIARPPDIYHVARKRRAKHSLCGTALRLLLAS